MMSHISEVYKFCPTCGSTDIYLREDKNSCQCGSCELDIYFGPVVNVSLIVKTNWGGVLLSCRKQETFPKCWEIPGGFAKPGETAEQAVTRIFFEEVGTSMRITRPKYLGSFPIPYEYNRVERPVLCLYFVALVTNGQPTQKGKSEWFAPEQVPWIEFGFESDKNALDFLLAQP